MKSIKYFSFVATALLALSCTLKIEKAKLAESSEFVAPVLSAVGPVLCDANTVAVEKVTYNWTPADLGVATEITYSVMAVIGDKEAILGQSNSTSLAVSKGDIVSVLVSDLNAAKNVDVPVQTYVAANFNGETIKSNLVNYTVFTYLAPKRSMFLPGNYQGWNSTGTEIWETSGGSNVYAGFVDVDGGTGADPCYFKFYFTDGGWQGFNDGWTAEWDMPDKAQSDGNFNVPLSEKYIRLTVNSKKKTVNREVVSAIELVGSFNGWNNAAGTPLVYSPAENTWSADVTLTADDEFLLLLNHSWDFKFGDGVAVSSEVPGGFELNESGSSANIKSPGAGTYTVTVYANRTPWVISFAN